MAGNSGLQASDRVSISFSRFTDKHTGIIRDVLELRRDPSGRTLSSIGACLRVTQNGWTGRRITKGHYPVVAIDDAILIILDERLPPLVARPACVGDGLDEVVGQEAEAIASPSARMPKAVPISGKRKQGTAISTPTSVANANASSPGTCLVLEGDSAKVLAQFPDNHFDSVVTDPPYLIGFLGLDWDAETRDLTAVFHECLRVLKPGGHLLAFSATRTHHRIATMVGAAGFEIRDMLTWIYAQGRIRRTNALKPAQDPIILARKPLEAKTIAANVRRWGVGHLNIDGCRIPDDGAKRQYPAGGMDRLAFGQGEAPKWDGRMVDANPLGRHPSNVIGDLPAEHQRFFYCPRASTKEKNLGCDALPKKPNGNHNPCVKPVELMRWLVRLVTPAGGIVLDPFMGSGTTGVAAVKEGCGFVGIDLDGGYYRIAEARIQSAGGKLVGQQVKAQVPTEPSATTTADGVPTQAPANDLLDFSAVYRVKKVATGKLDVHQDNTAPLTSVSLFSGAGGLSLGCEMAGFKTKVAVEFDHHAAVSFAANLPNTLMLNRSVVGMDLAQFPEVDLIEGGPPCQDFSRAGKRAGINGAKGQLIYAYRDFVLTKRPKAFLMENVAGLLDKDHRPAFDRLISDLEAGGYTVTWRVLTATDYGVAQSRQRVFVVGYRKDLGIRFDFGDVKAVANHTQTIRDAIGDLTGKVIPVAGGKHLTGHEFAVGPGDRYMHIGVEGKRRTVRGWNQPSYTVVARSRSVPLHPEPIPLEVVQAADTNTYVFSVRDGTWHRRITVREARRLQGFPDSFRLETTSLTAAYRMVGNAVPPPLAAAVASVIMADLLAVAANRVGEAGTITKTDETPIRAQINDLLDFSGVYRVKKAA